MAIRKCKECRKEVSTDAKVCPSCGKKNPTGERIGCIAAILIVFVIAIVMQLFKGDDEPASVSKPAVAPPAAERTVPPTSHFTVPYRTMEEWEVGKSIVIDSKYRNDSSMRALGTQLARERAGNTHYFVFIFDAERAAKMRLSVIDETDAGKLAFYDRHFLASYTRNRTTSFNKFQYSLKGFPIGDVKTLEY